MTNFPKKRLQVFVSSTYTDLIEERQAAVEAILTAGHIPAGMELFAAGDESQMEVIRHWIDESDVFLLILGSRYGSLEPKSEKSYIELEYEYAFSKNKPIFACVINQSIEEKRTKKRGLKFIERDNLDKLNKFRKSVCEKVVSFWKDSKDIKLAIHATLLDFSKRSGLAGWIKGSDRSPLSSTKTLIFDIDGTIVTSNRPFDDAQGKKLMEIFSKLISGGFYIVLITSNDYDKQWERILKPFIDKGIAEHTFCFSDGGTRAFKFKKQNKRKWQAILFLNQQELRVISIHHRKMFVNAIGYRQCPPVGLMLPGKVFLSGRLGYRHNRIHPPGQTTKVDQSMPEALLPSEGLRESVKGEIMHRQNHLRLSGKGGEIEIG